MSTTTARPPIWERQGRPKPPPFSAGLLAYGVRHHRSYVHRSTISGRQWVAYGVVPGAPHLYETHAEAFQAAARGTAYWRWRNRATAAETEHEDWTEPDHE